MAATGGRCLHAPCVQSTILVNWHKAWQRLNCSARAPQLSAGVLVLSVLSSFVQHKERRKKESGEERVLVPNLPGMQRWLSAHLTMRGSVQPVEEEVKCQHCQPPCPGRIPGQWRQSVVVIEPRVCLELYVQAHPATMERAGYDDYNA